MKRFLVLVNPAIAFGRGLNALAHLSMGIGHWIPMGKMPNITVLFAEEKTIREFREEARRIMLEHQDDTIASDFTNTMTERTIEECLKLTADTLESRLIYYAVGICTEEEWLESSRLNQIIDQCRSFKNYRAYFSGDGQAVFQFKEKTCLPSYESLPVSKISLVLDRKRSLAELVNAVVVSSLGVGVQTALSQVRLVIYIDADHQKHPYISGHSFPILSARPQSKFNEFMHTIEKDPNLLMKIVRDEEENAVAVCMLGTEDQVNAYTRQKCISLWTAELPEDAFASEVHS